MAPPEARWGALLATAPLAGTRAWLWRPGEGVSLSLPLATRLGLTSPAPVRAWWQALSAPERRQLALALDHALHAPVPGGRRLFPLDPEGALPGMVEAAYDDAGTPWLVGGVIPPPPPADHGADWRASRSALDRAHRDVTAAEQAKTRFLTMMTHEVRTSLNQLQGTLALLNDTLLPAQRPSLQDAHAASAELHHLLDQALAYARLESGEERLSPHPTDLAAEVRAETARWTPPPGPVRLTVQTEETLPATVDAAAVRRLLGILLANALAVTTVGRVTVTLETRTRGAGQQAVLSVTDTGPGLAPAQQERVFEAFDRGDDGGDRRRGSGLGLAIGRHLAILLGGTLEVHSRPGLGTTFQARWPLSAPGEIALSRPARVLVAEDVPVAQTILRRFLEAAGCTVVVVETGAAAVAAVTEAASAPFDVVLMDIAMPDMDGVTATRHIRALPPPTGQVPVVAVTAYAREEEAARFRAAGMNAVLAKPIGRERVLAVVAAALDDTLDTPPDSSPAPALPVLDRTTLSTLLHTVSPATAAQLRDHVTHELTTAGPAVQAAAHDRAALGRWAHRLKSTAAYFGARRLHQEAADVQATAETGPDAALAPAARRLADLVRETLAAVQRLPADVDTPPPR